MRPIYNFIIKPHGERYNNSTKVDGKDLILNTEIFNHQYVNREGIIISSPIYNPHNLQEQDKVLVHHNVFRRWHNVKGVEKNTRGYLKEDQYLISEDQVFMYYRDNTWNAMPGFTFVKPLKSKDEYSLEQERPLVVLLNTLMVHFYLLS